MALIFLEGFDAYGTTINTAPAGIARKWTIGNASGTWLQNGRISGKSLRVYNGQFFGFTCPATQTLIIGFGFRVQSRNLAETRVLEFKDGPNVGINLRQEVSGEWSIYLNTTHIATTSGHQTSVGGWQYVELRVKVDNSAGEYELRVNTQTVLSATGVDTQPASNAYTDTIVIAVTDVTGPQFDFDDLYLLDETGAVNNTFKGPVKVHTIFPAADSAVDCTPSTGSDNYAMTDDNPVNDDTDYVTGGAADIDLYDYGAIDASVVHGLMVNTICRETDASPLTIKQLAKSGSTTGDDGGAIVGSTSYVHRKAIFETNPDTAAAWTPSEVNAAQFGFSIE